MQKIKKIFFTLFLIIVSISAVNAKDTLLTCEYYKPYDQLSGSQEAGVLCLIYDDYSHRCFINVGEESASPSHNEEKIQNWGYAVGLTWQAKKYVEENNKCPDYLLLKLESGINGYEIHAAASKEDLKDLQSKLNGQRYSATWKGFNHSEDEKQKKIDEVDNYTKVINSFVDTFSFDNCADYNNLITRYDKCDTIISNNYTQFHTFKNNVDNWMKEGYFSQYSDTYENFYEAFNKYENLHKTLKEELDKRNEEVKNEMENGSSNNNNNNNNNYNSSKIENFCQEKGVLKSLRFLGYLLLVVKIVIPILLIIFGTLDFSKALMSSDNDAMQKSTKSLVTRVIAGIIIFFIPTIVNFVFTLAKSDNSSFENCRTCIFKPSDCEID